MKLPATVYPDDDGMPDYPYSLGSYNAAKLLHIVSDDPYVTGAICGVSSPMRWKITEFISTPHPVCVNCRTAMESETK